MSEKLKAVERGLICGFIECLPLYLNAPNAVREMVGEAADVVTDTEATKDEKHEAMRRIADVLLQLDAPFYVPEQGFDQTLLAKHQWAHRSPAGYDNRTTSACPECGGIYPGGIIVDGRRVRKGKGHKPGCAIAEALVGYDGECKGDE